MLFRIIIILIIPVLSLICALMTSGIENIITANNKNWHTIPLITWLLIWVGIWYFVYKSKFGSTKKLKIAIFKLIIWIRNQYLALNITENKSELNQIQKNAIQLCNKLIKDKESELSCCVLTNRKMVVKSDTICVISMNPDAQILVTKTSDSSFYYEVWLPQSIVSEMFNLFDKEQKLRFQKMVEQVRQSISDSVANL